MDTSNFKQFDMAEMLKSKEDIQNYLYLVIEEGDDEELAHALSVIAKVRNSTSSQD